jgi:tyrosine-protein kinase Etk/Wzc
MANVVVSQLPKNGSAAFVFACPAGENGNHFQTLLRLAEAISPHVDREVLVVDANSGDTHAGVCFGSPTDRGLTEVLEGRTHWQDFIRPLDSGGVHALRLGDPMPTNVADRFPMGAFARLLDQFRSRYRLVLVCTSALSRDPALSLAQLCDGVYLLVQLGRTPKRATKRAVTLLDRCGARLLGCIVADS